MKQPENPFTEAALRTSHRVFAELVAAAGAGTISPELIAMAARAVKTQKNALIDIGIDFDKE
jgi:hypothetical protein